MRALHYIVSIGCVAAAADAHAERIALLTDPTQADALRAALQLALHDVDVMDLPAPEGELRLDRAAVAQRTAVAAGADAGVWIDAREVWVVSAGGGMRHAPLPGDSPRAFAAITASLLDELAAPPEDGIDIDVHIDLDDASPCGDARDGDSANDSAGIDTARIDNARIDNARSVPCMRRPARIVGARSTPPHGAPPTAAGFADGAAPGDGAPPGMYPAYRRDRVDAAARLDDGRPVNWRRTLIEVGPMLSPLSGGLDAEVTFPVRERLRVGVMGFGNVLFVDDHALLFGGGVEARRVGLGRKHTDLGIIAGAAGAAGEPAMFFSARIGRVWERPGSGIGISLSPTLMVEPGRGKVLPAIWASLHWTFPV